jgi:hypothetical protein
MRGTTRLIERNAIPAMAAFLLAACSAHVVEEGTSEPWYNKTMMELASGSRASGEPAAAPTLAVAHSTEPLRAAPTTEDLYRGDGNCGGMPPGPTAGEQPSTSPLLTGPSLEMTECDAVKRMGPPDKVELLKGEHGERSLVLTYRGGTHAGIYRFLAGRLVGIERTPALPASTTKASGKRRAV